MSQAAPRYRVNWKALLGVGLALLVLIVVVVVLQVVATSGRDYMAQAEALLARAEQGLEQAGQLEAQDQTNTQDYIKAVNQARDGIQAALNYMEAHVQANPKDFPSLKKYAETLEAWSPMTGGRQSLVKSSELWFSLYESGVAGPEYREVPRKIATLALQLARGAGPTETEVNLNRALTFLERYLQALEAAGEPIDVEDYRLLVIIQANRALPPSNVRGAAEAAIAAFEQAEALEPGYILGAELLSRVYLELAEPEMAESVLTTMLETNPDQASAHLVYAMFLSQQGRTEEVAEPLERALALEPESATVRLLCAEYALNRGDVEAAEGHYEAIPESSKETLNVVRLGSEVALRRGRVEEAIDQLRQGARISAGQDNQAIWQLAKLLLQLGRLEEAEQAVNRYADLVGDANDARLLFLQGLQGLRRGQPELALVKFDQAELDLGADLNRDQARYRAEALQALGQLEEANTILRGLAEEGNDLRAWLQLVQWDLQRPQAQGGGIDAALERVDAALGRFAGQRVLVELKARLLITRQTRRPPGERAWEPVLAFLQDQRQILPESTALVAYQVQVLQVQGRLDVAEAVLRQALDQQPEATSLWVRLAGLLSGQGRYRDALAVLQSARPVATDPMDLTLAEAGVRNRQGNYQTARELIEARLEDPGLDDRQRAAGLRGLAQLAARQNRLEETFAALQRWRQVDPEDLQPIREILRLALANGRTELVDQTLAELERMGRQSTTLYRSAVLQRDLNQLRSQDLPEAQRQALLERGETLLAQIRERDPQGPDSYLIEGVLAQQLGELDRAILALQQAVANGGQEAALTRLGQVLVETGDPRRIEQVAADLELIQGGDPDLGGWKLGLLAEVGQQGLVEAEYRRLCREQPQQLENWERLIQLLAGQRRGEEATEVVQQMMDQVEAGTIATPQPDLVRALGYQMAGDRDRTDAAYQRAVQGRPNDPAVLRYACQYYRQSNQPERAEPLLERVLQQAPETSWARRQLALILSAKRFDDRAFRRAVQLVSDAPGGETATDQAILAQILGNAVDQDRRNQAVPIVQGLLEQQPRSILLHELTGRLLLSLQRYAEALPHAEFLVEAQPDRPTAQLLLARVLIELDRRDEAGAVIQRIVELAPTSLATVEIQVRFLIAEGRTDEATRRIRNYLQARQESLQRAAETEGSRLIALLAQLDQLEAAFTITTELLGGSPIAQLTYAEAVGDLGRIEQALTICERVAASDPPSLAGAARIAIESLFRGDRTEAQVGRAASLAERAAEADPESFLSLSTLALARHVQGRYDQELEVYDRIEAIDPPNSLHLNNKAWTVGLYQNRPEQGLRLIDEAIERVGPLPDFLDTRGVILAELGRHDSALEALVQAVDSAPESRRGLMLFHLAWAYHVAGQDQQFRETLQRAKANGFTPATLDPQERARYNELPSL